MTIASSSFDEVSVDDPWWDVVGQHDAVGLLRRAAAGDPVHAWLLHGPHGSGKRAAARAFAADLLAAEALEAGDLVGARRARDLARLEQHPDLMVIERVGAAISADQARDIVKRASQSPVEGRRKVLVLDEFHLIQPNVGPILLKSIEEPTAGTFFVVLADEVTRDLVTVASRCVVVPFVALTQAEVTDRLVAEGVEAPRAAEAASFAGGDLGRARMLSSDDRLALRLAGWRDLPRRLNGSGAAATAAVDDLRAAIDDAEAPLKSQQEGEVAEMQERIERYGQRGSGAKALEERHKRERRRLRTDELRLGLAALAGSYRDEMAVAADPTQALGALAVIQEASERLLHNPNEELWLVGLALGLPSLS